MGILQNKVIRALSLCGCYKESVSAQQDSKTIENNSDRRKAANKGKTRLSLDMCQVSVVNRITPRLCRQSTTNVASRRHLLRHAVSESVLTVATANRSTALRSCEIPYSLTSEEESKNNCKRLSAQVTIPIDEETGAHIIVTGETPLHLALHQQPPLYLIKKMIEDCPERVHQQNILGMTPLHIAAASGASPGVMEALVKVCPAAVGVVDHKSRTPLHLICMNTHDCDTGNSHGDVVKGPFLPAIRVLLKVSFPQVNKEDDYGKTPLEYAIGSNASINVIKALHKASESEWKACKYGSFKSSHASSENGFGAQSACSTFQDFDDSSIRSHHCGLTILSRDVSGESVEEYNVSGMQMRNSFVEGEFSTTIEVPSHCPSHKSEAKPLQRYPPVFPANPSVSNLESGKFSDFAFTHSRVRRRGAIDLRGSFYDLKVAR